MYSVSAILLLKDSEDSSQPSQICHLDHVMCFLSLGTNYDKRAIM
jgi:hypothetical protein